MAKNFIPEFATHDIILADPVIDDTTRARFANEETAAYVGGQERVQQETVDTLAAYTLRTTLTSLLDSEAAQDAIAEQLDQRGKLDV